VRAQGKNRHIQNAALRLLLFAVELFFALRFPDVLELLVALELLFVFEIPGR
jgi:hypothetical protein